MNDETEKLDASDFLRALAELAKQEYQSSRTSSSDDLGAMAFRTAQVLRAEPVASKESEALAFCLAIAIRSGVDVPTTYAHHLTLLLMQTLNRDLVAHNRGKIHAVDPEGPGAA